MSLVVAAGFAITSGLCNSLASVIVSYPAHLARVRKIEQTFHERVLTMVLNQLLLCIGVIMSIIACGQGPVAVVFPCQVAATLSSNMIMQAFLGVSAFDKNQRVGVYLLVVAVILISQMGPHELGKDINVLALLNRSSAIVFIIVSLAIMICSTCALACKLVEQNNASLILYVLVGSTATVLNTSIAKALQMKLHPALRVTLTVAFMALGGTSVSSEMTANIKLEDPSLFVPLSNGMNLLLNFFSGVSIWGDMNRLPTSPLNYIAIYIIVVLGTYLVSSFDMIRTSALQEKAQLFRDFRQKPFKVTKKPLLPRNSLKTQLSNFSELDLNSPDLEKRLIRILDKSVISHKEVVQLLMKEHVWPDVSELLKAKQDAVNQGNAYGSTAIAMATVMED